MRSISSDVVDALCAEACSKLGSFVAIAVAVTASTLGTAHALGAASITAASRMTCRRGLTSWPPEPPLPMALSRSRTRILNDNVVPPPGAQRLSWTFLLPVEESEAHVAH